MLHYYIRATAVLVALLLLVGFSFGRGQVGVEGTEPRAAATSSAAFPVGIYYVAHSPEQRQRRIEDLPVIAAGGFTAIHTPINLDDGPFLDACQAHGLSVIAEFNADPQEIVSRFGSHPAIMAWASYDDVDEEVSPGVRRYLPAEVKAVNEGLEARTPETLTYISGGYPARLPEYAGTADLLAVQIYPVPSEPLSSVFDILAELRAPLQTGGQTTLVNLQLFPLDGENRYPTPDELRNMTYQAAAAGVQGIVYYTFYDEVTDLRSQPDLWNAVVNLAKELSGRRRFFTDGSYCRLNSTDGRAVGAVLHRGKEQLVIMANTSEGNLRTVFSGCNLHRAFQSPRSMAALQAVGRVKRVKRVRHRPRAGR